MFLLGFFLLFKVSGNESFIEFVQKYPECYSVAKSPVLLRFLKSFSVQPYSVSEFLTFAPQIEPLDVKLAILALESARLVEKSKSIQAEVYHITPKGRAFLEKYESAKKA